MCAREVSMVFQECFKGVLSGFLVGFKLVLRVFESSSNSISGKLPGCFKEISRVFPGSF